MNPGDQCYVLNSRGTRASSARVISVSPEEIVVWNQVKNEEQYFHPETFEALGSYWYDGEQRPTIVPLNDPRGMDLTWNAEHRKIAQRMLGLVTAYKDSATQETMDALHEELDRWEEHTAQRNVFAS